MRESTATDFSRQNPVAMDNLQRLLGGQTVLHGICASVQPGDVVGLLGKNGAGKTTLLETLLGFGLPAFGQVRLWGEVSAELSSGNKHRIGYVPQRDELPPNMTAAKLFKLYSQLRPRWNSELVDRLMDEWELWPQRRIHKMSEGQKQKLAIVLALAHEPELLVLDEPVASLDPLARRQFLQQLMDYAAADNRSIIFSSHIVSDMERIANRIWCLKEGQLIFDQPLDDLYQSVVRIAYTGELDTQKLSDESWVLRHDPGAAGGQIIVRGWDEKKQQRLNQIGARALQVSGLGLEEIFLYMQGGHRV